MNKQRIVAGLASVAMASTLVACSGGSNSDAKTLTVSVNQSLTGQFTPQYASCIAMLHSVRCFLP